MLEKVNERVDCITVYKKEGGIVMPYKIKWNGRTYTITKLGYHHKQKIGTVVHHIFSVATSSLAFRLRFDPDTLFWHLEEVSDGNSN